MEGASHDLLAAAVLAGDEDAAVGRRGAADLLVEPLHHVAVADEQLVEGEVTPQVAHFGAQFRVGQGVVDGQQHALERERLLQEVVRAEARGPDGRVDVAVPGDHDDGRRAGSLETLQHGHAVDAAEPEVEQHEIELLARERGDAFLPRLAGRGLVPLVGEDARQRGADGRFVVDDQDLCHVLSDE